MPAEEDTWEMTLFIMDGEPRSLAAKKNLERVWAAYPAYRFHVNIVDLQVHPEIARQQQILAIPTLKKSAPWPPKVLVGDFSIVANVLKGLGINKMEVNSPEGA